MEMSLESHSTPPSPILVAGAGATGLIAALALARRGRAVTLVGKTPPPLHGRTVALFEGSLRALDALGLGGIVDAESAAIDSFRIVDDTGSIFAPPPAIMHAHEIGLKSFGRNIGNDDLVRDLAACVAREPNITRIDGFIANYAFRDDGVRVELDDGRSLETSVVIAADGHKSMARAAAEIGTREWAYPQLAMTALLRHRRPHHAFSTEFHTRGGPFTFVPLAPKPDAPHRSSLVWLMSTAEGERRKALDRAALTREIEDLSRHWFGAIAIEGEIAVFPMRTLQAMRVTAPRLLLVGEAAHAFPPLAAQGLNLGIRDVADAVAALDGFKGGYDDLERALARYEDSRRADIDVRTRMVDLLNRSLLIPFLPVDILRGAALGLVSLAPPLRRAILAEGIMPTLASRPLRRVHR
jgi:2-octaprenyl-6-methoxyphenol hydroxylase